jgi:hypothetical protein
MSPDMWGRPALIEQGEGGLDGRETKEEGRGGDRR